MSALSTSLRPPVCWIVAGPNGAGKTTFALRFLRNLTGARRFINADSIASGLSPLEPARELAAASRIFLTQLQRCISDREDFSFETTLAGRSYLGLIDQLQIAGWRVELIYLALPDVAASKARVAERVLHGGHDIPAADLERRFARSLRNLLQEFASKVDSASCYLNTAKHPRLVFWQKGNQRHIVDMDIFVKLEQDSRT